MLVHPIRTPRIQANEQTLTALLDGVLTDMPAGSVLAITSKIVSLCEGAVVPLADIEKRALIHEEAEWDLPGSPSKYGIHFTVKHHTLIPTAGIDESNAGDIYVLWPRDPQQTANDIRAYLVNRFNHTNLGVIITDSTSRPFRYGVSGIALAWSGLRPLNSYIGKADLYGRPFEASQADVAGGLAAAAVLTMGEGAESTPLAVLSDLPFVEFTGRDPEPEEVAEMQIGLEDDLFAPFWQQMPWQKGGSNPN